MAVKLLLAQKLTHRRVAALVGKSLGFVSTWAHRETFERREGSGRPRCTTKRDDKKIVKIARKQLRSSVRKLSANMKKRDVKVSATTIRRRLAEAGVKAYMSTKVPKLSDSQKMRRIEWRIATYAVTYAILTPKFCGLMKYGSISQVMEVGATTCAGGLSLTRRTKIPKKSGIRKSCFGVVSA